MESLQRKPPPALGEEQVVYDWEFEVRGHNGFNDSKAGRKPRRSEVDSVQGVLGAQKRAVLLGGKGMLLLEPPEGGSSRLGTQKEGALSMWLSREQPGAGPVVTTYAGNRPVLQLRFDEEGRLRFGMGEHQLRSPRALVLGRFFHVALEWGPTGRQLWIDGERVAQEATPGEALGEHLVIGWDERVPGELAPAFVMDQLRIHSGIPPLDTWPRAQKTVPEELRSAP
ncbi:LamG-like jellyroll fold domain-containing protein [Archangium violaceum]|uniref:LamG-like jellyroll fold domain-containing protein n=1 Tax=Archangium violaceum TaxID=83451 RepID=UPI0036DDEA1D